MGSEQHLKNYLSEGDAENGPYVSKIDEMFWELDKPNKQRAMEQYIQRLNA